MGYGEDNKSNRQHKKRKDEQNLEKKHKQNK